MMIREVPSPHNADLKIEDEVVGGSGGVVDDVEDSVGDVDGEGEELLKDW